MRTKIQTGDVVMLRQQSEQSPAALVNCHLLYTVVDMHSNQTLQLQGIPEPQPIAMFDRMVIGKVKGFII